MSLDAIISLKEQIREFERDYVITITEIRAELAKLSQDDNVDDYEAYGDAWKECNVNKYDCILPTGLCDRCEKLIHKAKDDLCERCEQIYKHILAKELVNKSCSLCEKYQAKVLSCRAHSLCACSMECAETLAKQYGFSLMRFDGAYMDNGKIIIPDFNL